MKKSLFAVAMAVILLATNCQKTEIMNPSGTSIVFDSQIGKLTKAEDPAGLETLENYGFRVWAYRNFSDEYYAVGDDGMNHIYDGMSGLSVTWDGSNWGTTKDYYWPGANKTLKFFAVSCNEVDFPLDPTTTNAVTPNPDAGTITVSNFEVKSDANNDLMVADMITQGQGDAINGNTVKPAFRHTLTKVQFNFKTDKETVDEHPVYVLSLTTSKLKTTATLTHPFEATQDVTSPWSSASGEVEFTDDNTTPITLPKKKDANGNDTSEPIDVDGEQGSMDRKGLTLTENFAELDTWLLLPQDIYDDENETGATVVITYIIKDRWFQKTFPLYADDLKEWKHNQFVKYNVTIAPNLISFNPTVENWETTDVTMDDNGTNLTTTPDTPTTTTKTYNVKDGQDADATITVEQAGETPAVGETASPDGTYTMEDGTTIVITGGKIESITAPADPQA